MAIFETLIGAGTSLLGGLLNRSAQEEANEANRAMAERNIQLQKEFANNAISWRVEDAKRAGIHPLYAIGASGSSFSPVSIGAQAETGLGNALTSMGQDISRADFAGSTGPQRVAKMAAAQNLAAGSLRNQGAGIQNEMDMIRLNILKLQYKKLLESDQMNPPPPGPFKVEEGKVEQNPPLMIGGSRVPDDTSWSPTKAVSDRWGDESFATNAYGNIKAVRDLYATYASPFLADVMKRRQADQLLWQDWSRKNLAPNTNPRYRGYSNR